jgi:hypothetical protein
MGMGIPTITNTIIMTTTMLMVQPVSTRMIIPMNMNMNMWGSFSREFLMRG